MHTYDQVISSRGLRHRSSYWHEEAITFQEKADNWFRDRHLPFSMTRTLLLGVFFYAVCIDLNLGEDFASAFDDIFQNDFMIQLGKECKLLAKLIGPLFGYY